MKSVLFCTLYFLAMTTGLIAQDDVIGFWKTIDRESGKAESIVAIYEYQNKYYGRIIVTIGDDGLIKDTLDSPKDRAPGVEGHPFYAGLDIIWDLKKEGSKYVDGKILDPEKGRVYQAEMWRNHSNLIVRGKIWIFGENQEWLPAADSDFPADLKKPDLNHLVPVIPKVKRRRADADEN